MIKNVLIIFSLLLCPILVRATDKVFVLEFSDNSENIEYINVSVRESFFTEEQKPKYVGEDYFYNIIDKNGSILKADFFSLVTKQEEMLVATATVTMTTSSEEIIKVLEIEIPFNNQADKILIFTKAKVKIGESDVAKFLNSCGDNTCQDFENYSTCAKDCPPNGNDGYCFKEQNGVCDPDCLGLGAETGDKDCPLDRNDYNPDLEKKEVVADSQAQINQNNISNPIENINNNKKIFIAVVLLVLGLVGLLLGGLYLRKTYLYLVLFISLLFIITSVLVWRYKLPIIQKVNEESQNSNSQVNATSSEDVASSSKSSLVELVDTDKDGIYDKYEIEATKTDPNNPDTDGDGFSDGDEIKNGFNPLGEGKLEK